MSGKRTSTNKFSAWRRVKEKVKELLEDIKQEFVREQGKENRHSNVKKSKGKIEVKRKVRKDRVSRDKQVSEIVMCRMDLRSPRLRKNCQRKLRWLIRKNWGGKELDEISWNLWKGSLMLRRVKRLKRRVWILVKITSFMK
jgi:hypothetical protein